MCQKLFHKLICKIMSVMKRAHKKLREFAKLLKFRIRKLVENKKPKKSRNKKLSKLKYTKIYVTYENASKTLTFHKNSYIFINFHTFMLSYFRVYRTFVVSLEASHEQKTKLRKNRKTFVFPFYSSQKHKAHFAWY